MGLKFSWGSTFHGVQILMQVADYITKESVNYEADGQTWTVKQMLYSAIMGWCKMLANSLPWKNTEYLMEEESIGW